MRLPLEAKISEQDYLAGERTARVRHEYVAGQVYAMAGASKAHNIIALNLATALRLHLRGRSCRCFMSDMKVRLAAQEAYYYPDVVVSCSLRDLAAETPAYYLEEPLLVVEVLSEATERIDRTEKLPAYQQLPSVREILLVEQHERRAELWHRTPAGWASELYGPEDTLCLSCIDLAFTVAGIYEESGTP